MKIGDKKHKKYMQQYQIQWRKNNLQKIRDYVMDWYWKNHERALVTARQSYSKNRENRIKNAINWGSRNPDKVLKYKQKQFKKCAIILNIGTYEFGMALLSWSKAVKKRDNYTCIECGSKENLHADHILPKAKYPKLALDIDNGRTLCNRCHYKRHWSK